jgi:hypothetical protein
VAIIAPAAALSSGTINDDWKWKTEEKTARQQATKEE